jgi:hypothetical protein
MRIPGDIAGKKSDSARILPVVASRIEEAAKDSALLFEGRRIHRIILKG